MGVGAVSRVQGSLRLAGCLSVFAELGLGLGLGSRRTACSLSGPGQGLL
jgi:hypothetical protein